MKILLTLFFCCISVFDIFAQIKTGSVIRLGVGTNYYHGKTSNTFGFQSDNLGFELDCMAAYRFAEKNSSSIVFGFFGKYGFVGSAIVEKMKNEVGVLPNVFEDSRNEFYEGELGVILFDVFRLSTGLGMQNYRQPNKSSQSLLYRNTTLGLHVHFRGLNWEIATTILHDRDIRDNLLRLSSAISVEF